MNSAKQAASISRSTLLCALTMLLGSFSVEVPAASGQGIPSVGRKVRVTAPSLGLNSSVGIVREMGEGTLVVDFSPERGTIPVGADAIRTLEVPAGQSSRVLRGVVIGLLVGGGIGAVVGKARGGSYECTGEPRPTDTMLPNRLCIHVTSSFKQGLGAVLGGALGAGIGVAVGRAFRTDLWRPASREGVTVSAQPMVDVNRLGLSVGVSF